MIGLRLGTVVCVAVLLSGCAVRQAPHLRAEEGATERRVFQQLKALSADQRSSISTSGGLVVLPAAGGPPVLLPGAFAQDALRGGRAKLPEDMADGACVFVSPAGSGARPSVLSCKTLKAELDAHTKAQTLAVATAELVSVQQNQIDTITKEITAASKSLESFNALVKAQNDVFVKLAKEFEGTMNALLDSLKQLRARLEQFK